MSTSTTIKKMRHRILGHGGFAIKRRNKRKVTYAEFKQKLKLQIIDGALYSVTTVLAIYAVFLVIGYLWVPGPELGILLVVLAAHAIWSSVRGSLSLKRDLAWLS